MMPRSLLLISTLVSGMAAPSHAQSVTLAELLSLDRLATTAGQMALGALRGVAEVTYAHLDIQPLAGRMVLTGLAAVPYASPDCRITLDRVVITTAPLDQIQLGALDIDVVGAEIGQGCFDPSQQDDLAQMGVTALRLDRGRGRLVYDYASGELEVDLSAVSDGMGELHAQASFAYFAVNIDSEEPVADLANAEITYTEGGYWARLSAQIPPAMLSRDALSAAMTEDWLRDAPAPELPPSDGKGEEAATPPESNPETGPETSAETGTARDVVDVFATAFARFAADPAVLRLTLAPDTPVRLTEAHFNDFATFANTLNPVLSAEPASPVPALSPEDIATLFDWIEWRGDDLSDSDRLRLARALMTGFGVPRDVEMGVTMLSPLLERGTPEALAMALGAIDALEPHFAYQILLQSAAEGNRAAFARLDEVEARLPLLDALELQDEISPGYVYTGAPARDLRRDAEAALTGLGAPRDYGRAYFLALLSMAAGDPGAGALVDEIEGMAARLDDRDATQLALTLGIAHGQATTAWFAAMTPPEPLPDPGQ